MIVRPANAGRAASVICTAYNATAARRSPPAAYLIGGDLAPEFVPFWDLLEWHGSPETRAEITAYAPPLIPNPLSTYLVHRATWDTAQGQPPHGIDSYRAGLVWGASTSGEVDFFSEIGTYPPNHGEIDGQLYILDFSGKRVQVSRSTHRTPATGKYTIIAFHNQGHYGVQVTAQTGNVNHGDAELCGSPNANTPPEQATQLLNLGNPIFFITHDVTAYVNSQGGHASFVLQQNYSGERVNVSNIASV